MPLLMVCDRCGNDVPEEKHEGGALRMLVSSRQFRKQYLCESCVGDLDTMVDVFIQTGPSRPPELRAAHQT